MTGICPKSLEADPSDHSVADDVRFRRQPDEEDERDDKNNADDDDEEGDEEGDDGYSE